MKEWNQLENQLRSWTLRRPAPNLKARIFSHSAAPARRAAQETAAPHQALLWSWLGPALAALMLVTLVLGRGPRTLASWSVASPTGLATVVLSSSTYYAAARHSDRNAPQATFAWTNGSHCLTTVPPLFQTNILSP